MKGQQKMSRISHFIDLDTYSVQVWNKIVSLAEDIKKNPAAYSDSCKGKIMATLFYEPSTRTQMSFQSAMMRLGGGIIGFDNPLNSSVAKGETIQDTIRMVSNYADLIVIRNPMEGSAKAAAKAASVPVINAGDGGHLHPTQTLTDLVTLKSEKGRLNNLKVGLCGDLRYGRTVHSLLKALSKYENNEFVLISTKELALPSYIKDILSARGCTFREVNSIEEAIGSLDVLYMTRIQKERFTSEEEYERQKDVFVLDAAKMRKAKQDMIVMHPLPRVDEITVEVDSDSRAKYFEQARNGVFARMSLILCILEGNINGAELFRGRIEDRISCTNPKCITSSEHYLEHYFCISGDIAECEYCDERMLTE